MAEVNIEDLQRAARQFWGVDYPEALRRATGMKRMDPNGIARAISGGTDMNLGEPTNDTLLEILTETTQVQSRIGTGPSTSGWTRKVMSIGSAPSVISATGSFLRFTAPAGAAAHGDGGLRDVWLRDGITGTNFEAQMRYELPGWNTNPTGSGVIFPQCGLAVRVTEDATKRRIVAVNNNVVYGLGHMNIGAWGSNLDGTGFLNRQAAFDALTNPAFPYNMKIRLVGNVIDVWYWGDNEPFPQPGNTNRYKRINLDTEAGSIPAGNETPTGVGGIGIIIAHIGNHIDSRIDITDFSARVLD